MSSEKYEMQEYIVASIDILGGKELIKESKGLQTVHSIYDMVINDLKSEHCNKQINIENLGVKIFSDNIVIYAKSKDFDNYEYMFFGVIAMVSLIQEKFLEKNILVRGGITLEDFFVDDVMVWGKALLKAYILESECAIYPRVIIDPCVINKINLLKEKSSTENDSVIVSDFLYKDKDGFLSVNYLLINHTQINYAINGETVQPFKGLFETQKGIEKVETYITYANQIIEKSYSDDKLMRKLKWHQNYLLDIKKHLTNSDPTHIVFQIKQKEEKQCEQ